MPEVLVVDDNAGIRRFLADLLAGEGYDVATVSNGTEALAQLRAATRSELVLLDLTMPVLDGYAVYRMWEREPALRDGHRLLVMSAAGRLQRGEFPLADGQLPKPFDLADLLDIVEVLVAQLTPQLPRPDAERRSTL